MDLTNVGWLARSFPSARAVLVLLAMVVVGCLIAACSNEEPTPSTGDHRVRQPTPATTVITATPSPAATQSPAPTSTSIPVATLTPVPAVSATSTPYPPSDGQSEDLTVLSRPPCPPPDSPDISVDHVPLLRYGHISSTLSDGRVVLGGGIQGLAEFREYRGGLHRTIDIYHPVLDEWCNLIVPERSRLRASVVALDGGALLFVGLDGDSPWRNRTTYAMIFDPYTLSFEEITPPIALRSVPTLALLSDGRVLSVGGLQERPVDETEGSEFSTDVEIFDPETGTWEKRRSIGAEPAATFGEYLQIFSEPWLLPTLDGNAIMVREGDIGDQEDITVIELYDVLDDTWTTVEEVNSYSYSPQNAHLGSDNRLYIFYDYSVDVLDLNTRSWTYSYSPRLLPLSGEITELLDGRLMLSGGTDRSLRYRTYPSGRTEIFDPSTMAWARGPELNEPRLGHSTTLLSDGSVLVLGGLGHSVDSSETPLGNTAEIISAEELSTIDADPQPGMPGQFLSPWPQCIKILDFERPPAAATQPQAIDVRPSGLRELSDEAMNRLASYAYESYGTEFSASHLAGSPFKGAECFWAKSEFESAEKHRTIISTARYRLNVFLESAIKTGGALYLKNFENESWREVIYRDRAVRKWTDLEESLHSTVWENVTPEALADSSIEGIDVLDGVDVYRLEMQVIFGGQQYDYTFWIGVHDSLMRMVHSTGLFENSEGMRYGEASVVRFHSFNQDFNIQPPPDDQIADEDG